MSANPQAESVIKNIIREICLECTSQGQGVSETLAAFMVRSDFLTKTIGSTIVDGPGARCLCTDSGSSQSLVRLL